MTYNSYSFAGFFVLTGLLYFCVPLRVRPYVLLAASAVFYLASGFPATIYLLTVVIATYVAGRLLMYTAHRRVVLATYVAVLVAALFFVKFTGYMLHVISQLLHTGELTLSVLVPLGVSFFTLQAIGYVVDVYRGKYKCELNFCRLALFLSYFPLIVQGPVSRYDQLTPTLFCGHRFDYTRVTFGLQLVLWGLFKKLVIANRAGIFVDMVFDDYAGYSGWSVIVATVLYAIQLYTDFSGCTDLCRGVSQVFGVQLMNNFDHPYFAVSVSDFWRRWHISLSTWLRDYVYIPLGGSRRGNRNVNLLLTFVVSGLWHGVGVHYLAWGVLHAVYQIVGRLTAPAKRAFCMRLHIDLDGRLYRLGRQCLTFVLVSYAWLVFRANGLTAALYMTYSIPRGLLQCGQLPQLFADWPNMRVLLIALLVLWLVSVLQTRISVRETVAKLWLPVRWTIYLAGMVVVVIYGVYGSGYNAADFLYMQF